MDQTQNVILSCFFFSFLTSLRAKILKKNSRNNKISSVIPNGYFGQDILDTQYNIHIVHTNVLVFVDGCSSHFEHKLSGNPFKFFSF